MNRLPVALFALFSLAACGNESTSSQSSTLSYTLRNYRFDLVTPVGERIFNASMQWLVDQIDEPSYPQPRMCASNVSRVLSDAGLGGYWSASVIGLVDNIADGGGKIVNLPRNPQGIARTINDVFHGRLPVGTVIVGCLNPDCSGEAGDGHAALVGDVDAEGNTKAYHNNWYRPDNNGGVWVPHMVSPHYYYDLGLLRQWMPTPWLKLERDNTGSVVKVTSVLPAIDDLDPNQYYVHLAIPAEILDEIALAQETDGKGNARNLSY